MVKTAETLTQSAGAKASTVCECEYVNVSVCVCVCVCVCVFAYVLVCKQVSEETYDEVMARQLCTTNSENPKSVKRCSSAAYSSLFSIPIKASHIVLHKQTQSIIKPDKFSFSAVFLCVCGGINHV